MRVGDRIVNRERAIAILADYAVQFNATVRLYDLGGEPDGRPGRGSAAAAADSVTLADIGRLVVINAALTADDVATLIEVDAAAEFSAVPSTAQLQNCAHGSALDHAATALYDKYRRPGIGQAKRSKLLHLKRPWLVPIADTRVMTVYRHRADALAAELGIASGHWEAMRADLLEAADDLDWLSVRLSDHQDGRVQLLSRLTALRHLDIIALMVADD
jgi:hypothetical protein